MFEVSQVQERLLLNWHNSRALPSFFFASLSRNCLQVAPKSRCEIIVLGINLKIPGEDVGMPKVKDRLLLHAPGFAGGAVWKLVLRNSPLKSWVVSGCRLRRVSGRSPDVDSLLGNLLNSKELLILTGCTC